MDRLFVERREEPGVTRLTISGEADLATSRMLRQAFDTVDGKGLVIDMRGLTFCDSSCLAALAFAAKRQRERGQLVTLVSPQAHIVALLERLHLLDLFRIV